MIIANPRQTHQFAQSQSLTKTDAKDAKMLAFFAQMMMQKEDWQTMLYHPPTEAEEVLEALVYFFYLAGNPFDYLHIVIVVPIEHP